PASPGIEMEWQTFSATLANPAEMKEFFEPNLYLYDAYPGGIGFSEPLFRVHDILLRRTRELIVGCPCEQGCPSCVGPAGEKCEKTKEAALAILERLCAGLLKRRREIEWAGQIRVARGGEADEEASGSGRHWCGRRWRLGRREPDAQSGSQRHGLPAGWRRAAC